jgi:hypothetical protein
VVTAGCLAVVLVGCSSDDGSSAASTTSSSTSPTTGPLPTVTNAQGYVTPTEAARRKARAIVGQRPFAIDCGVTAADAGWPTTTVGAPDNGRCLLDAFRSGEPALMDLTGRDQRSGTLATRYLLDRSKVVVILTYEIDARGRATKVERTCIPPANGTRWQVDVDGNLAVDGTLVTCERG